MAAPCLALAQRSQWLLRSTPTQRKLTSTKRTISQRCVLPVPVPVQALNISIGQDLTDMGFQSGLLSSLHCYQLNLRLAQLRCPPVRVRASLRADHPGRPGLPPRQRTHASNLFCVDVGIPARGIGAYNGQSCFVVWRPGLVS